MFYKKTVLKILAKFTGKHPYWSLFLIKFQAYKRLLLPFDLKTHSILHAPPHIYFSNIKFVQQGLTTDPVDTRGRFNFDRKSYGIVLLRIYVETTSCLYEGRPISKFLELFSCSSFIVQTHRYTLLCGGIFRAL